MERMKSLLDEKSMKWTSFCYYDVGDAVDCSQRCLPDGCIDLLITDPPYGIQGDTLHKHYNRDESFVIDGYHEIPEAEYADFSRRWIREAERVVRPGGSVYIVSGWTNLRHILNAVEETRFDLKNHIIWKYNFGVFTSKKFTTSHYHILYLTKPKGEVTFNTYARYSPSQKTEGNRSVLYADMEDVWVINREYKNGKIRHKNELPPDLLIKMIQYSSNEGDVLCDFFAGSFSLAKAAKGMNRNSVGFEISKEACEYQTSLVKKVEWGSLLRSGRAPIGQDDRPKNQGKPWSEKELDDLVSRFHAHREEGLNKRDAISRLQEECKRGYFSVLNALKKRGL